MLMTCALSTEKDKPIWNWESSGNFSVKSMYSHLCRNQIRLPYHVIWKAKLPLKIKVFLWQLLHDKLQSAVQLKRRNWTGEVNCVLCG